MYARHFDASDNECPVPSSLDTDTVVATDDSPQGPVNCTETMR